MSTSRAVLALEDGSVLEGRAFGALGLTGGEVVFHTAMTGYQEILTDPSYHGQIVAMTYPHIGNTGVNDEDPESSHPHVRGFVARVFSRRPSSWRSRRSLAEYLEKHGIAGDRLETKGFGETKPVDRNDTPEGKANNRRVELVKL